MEFQVAVNWEILVNRKIASMTQMLTQSSTSFRQGFPPSPNTQYNKEKRFLLSPVQLQVQNE